MSKINYQPVSIIGAGPAGISCAAQLKRLGIYSVLFEQDFKYGSLLKNAWRVENYFGSGLINISGINLLKRFRKNIINFNLKCISERIEFLDYNSSSKNFKLKTSKNIYHSDYVIVASGTLPRINKLIENESDFIKSRTFYEVFPLLKKRNKKVVIIGGGDAAFDNAMFLSTNKNNKVVICCYRNSAKALNLLVEAASKKGNISCYYNLEFKDIAFSDKHGLMSKFLNKNDNCEIILNSDYLLMAIGRVPNKNFYSDLLKLQEKKLISSNKLFLIGDVRGNTHRQVAIASADGINVATDLLRLRLFDVRNYI